MRNGEAKIFFARRSTAHTRSHAKRRSSVYSYTMPLHSAPSRTASRVSMTSVVVQDIWPSSLVQLLDYYPYGATRVSTSSYPTNEKRQYIGQFSDAQTNLDYLQARYYDNTRGQFVSQDPEFWNGKQNLLDPQSLNAYSYAQDNPITGKDPDGLALTAAQNDALNSIKTQLQAISALLSTMANSGGGSQSQLDSVQQAINSASSAVKRIAVGGNATVVSPTFQWSPPLANSNSITSFTPYDAKTGVSGIPGGSSYDNLQSVALTGLMLSPIGPEDALGAGGAKIIIKHEHAIQHLAEIGLSKAQVEAAINKDVVQKGGGPVLQSIPRIIEVAGKTIEYRVATLENGVINVGTYFLK
jgi:RHS repeat-associated protein